MADSKCIDSFYYGFRSLHERSGLWGGFAQYMEIVPRTKLYPVSDSLSIEDALLFNPLAAGYDWLLAHGELQVGETVLILGSGQRGLACVVAAVEAGEIGRASCRERVCQSVSISVVAGSLKNNDT